eukprot:scaffold37547_cov31-Tisochrysis_lutea.AAC.1
MLRNIQCGVLSSTVPRLPKTPAKIGTRNPLNTIATPILHKITSLFFLLESPHYKLQVCGTGKAVTKKEGFGLMSAPFSELFGVVGSSKDEQWYKLLIVVQGATWDAIQGTCICESTTLALHFESM